jgi:CubicO group peptidase (beta-lactamase class C family)
MDWKYQHPFYLLQGHQGQYVIVVPKQKLVIVRLGQFRNKTMGSGGLAQEIYDYVDAAVLMAEKAANQP